MARQEFKQRTIVAATATIMVLAGCINTFWHTEARAVARPAIRDTVVITTPVKAHLTDGSTVIFRQGALLTGTHVVGSGESYALLSTTAVSRGGVPLDSVVGLETFEGKRLAAQSLIVSTAATVGGTFAVAALAVAVLGSCPTVYADTGRGAFLEAEGFSYAIAPLLEHRDVDPLRVRAGQDGMVRLELRNEALETHFINHVELLAVRHASDARVVPDQSGQPVVVGGLRPIDGATDRAGRNVRATLAAADGRMFASAPSVVDAARIGDLDDWIDLDLRNLPPGDSVAIVLRLRNSLLNTVLLYDGVLNGRDAPNWLANEMQQIAAAVELARWYVRTMGLRASVEGVGPSGAARNAQATRLGDVGPPAFRDVAMLLPRPARDSRDIRVRLRFVADNWRIDRVEVATTAVRAHVAAVPIAQVIVPHTANSQRPALDTAAVSALVEADERYLETRPGQRMTLAFAPGQERATSDSSTTFLIAWQGWYNEWIRGKWLAAPVRTTAFRPGDDAVLTALRRWRERQTTLERVFYRSRIPVR